MTDLITKMNQIGQSIWYDNIERKLLEDGTLSGMVLRGEIKGITSNPSIFNQAISQSSDYDQEIQSLAGKGMTRQDIYEQLVVSDIQKAADLFRPLYEETDGADGYVSLEVSPYLAHQIAETISEARKLWKLVDRPNLMVKIPATIEGIPAITETIANGINVNVTLIFGLDRYQQVMDAYLAGLEKRSATGNSISGIASVASFFISRIDSKVDQQLESLLENSDPADQEEIRPLMGKAALASGKLAFELYEDNFGKAGSRYQKLVSLGARRQRVLWASTSTKNPSYPDTMYVDELIGPETVNTIPPKTLMAFLDHGKGDQTINHDIELARKVFEDLSTRGVDMRQVTQALETEGVESFAEAFTSLLDSLEKRMADFKA